MAIRAAFQAVLCRELNGFASMLYTPFDSDDTGMELCMIRLPTEWEVVAPRRVE
jgi:hypothetical protein